MEKNPKLKNLNSRLSLAYETARQARATQWTNYLDIVNPIGLVQSILGGGAIAQGDLTIANLDLRAAEIEAALEEEINKISERILSHLLSYERTTQELSNLRQRYTTFNARVQLIESSYREGRYSTETMLPLWEERDRAALNITSKEQELEFIKSQISAIVSTERDTPTENMSLPYIPPASPLIGTVQHISDGDTITVKTPVGQIRIRLACIDAPESTQTGGDVATKHLKTLIPVNSPVELFIHNSDKYGRYIADIYDQSGSLVQLKLVEAGSVFVYDRFMSNCTDPDSLKAAEEKAKKSRLGVWEDPNMIKPWDYRAKNRMNP